MKIIDVYDKYKIMPNLQMHQLKVAGVAKLVCDNFTQKVDTNSIVAACLLHDIGNIIKFKLEFFSEFLEPEGLEYWQKIQDDFKKKYGNDEHQATYKIVKEIGASSKIFNLVNTIGFSKGQQTFESSDFEVKIVAYSDHRVAPFGVTSMDERMLEGRKRYVENKNAKFEPEVFDRLANFARKTEKQIFAKCSIKPQDINDDSVNPLIEDLKSFEIAA